MNIGSKYLKAWLAFNHSPTEDLKGNTWTTYGNPTIGTANAINGNALQLEGQSYIKLSGIKLGGQDFYIDGWLYVDSASPNYARILSIVNPTNGYHLLSFRKSPNNSAKLDFWCNSTLDVSKDSGYTYTESTSSVGQRVHFKLIYRYGNNLLLCINDKTVAINYYALEYDRQTFDVYIGALPNGNQGLIGSIDELRIYDGTYFSYDNGNVPTVDEYTDIFFKADSVRKVLNPPLTWLYENYGTAELLTQEGTTVELSSDASIFESGFYQPTRTKCFDIPATKEIWIKCDVYTTPDYADGDRIRIYSKDADGVNGWCTQTPKSTLYQLWHNGTSQNGSQYLASNKRRTVLLHMISDESNGVVECTVGNVFFAFTGNVNNGNDFANVYIQMDGSNILVSNLIISNAPIDANQNARLIKYPQSCNFDIERKVVYKQVSNYPITYTIDAEFKIDKTIRRTLEAQREVALPVVVQPRENGFIWKGQLSAELIDGNVTYNPLFPYSVHRIILPANTNEVWVQFRLTFPTGGWSLKFFVGEENNATGIRLYTDMLESFNGVDNNQYPTWFYGYPQVLMHIKSGFADGGLLEISIVDTDCVDNPEEYNLADWITTYTKTGNVNNGQPLDTLFVSMPTAYWSSEPFSVCRTSDIVVSSGELDIKGRALWLDPIIDLHFDLDCIITKPVPATFDILTNIQKSLQVPCDALRKIVHKLIVMPAENGMLTSETLSRGLQSIQIDSETQKLTDNLNFTTKNPVDIMEQVKGQYLDYHFDMRVEDITQSGILYSCACCSDIDEILYKPLNYEVPEVSQSNQKWHDVTDTKTSDTSTTIPRSYGGPVAGYNPPIIKYTYPTEEDVDEYPKASASTHAFHIASAIGKKLCFFCDDFVSTVDVDEVGVTYGDLIDNIFGWSARLPQMMINCYFRANKFYVVQRGHEPNTIDITQSKHTVPIIKKSLVRTMWANAPYLKTEVRTKENWNWSVTNTNWDDEDPASLAEGYQFDDDGLVSRSVTNHGDSTTVTEYKYTTLGNGKKFLSREIVSTYENGELVDERTTTHEPLGQGQKHTYSEDSEGDFIGGAVGSGKDDDRYNGRFITFERIMTSSTQQERQISGIPLFDTSFPVYGESKLIELTRAIEWLNRKIKEIVTMDIYDYPHFIDFTDKIILNGNEYFLDSNSATKTPRIVNKQKISIVRWY